MTDRPKENSISLIWELKSVSCIFTLRNGISGKGQRLHALDRMDLDIPEGRALAVVGESGSGKTTLVKLLAGLLRPAGGEILFKGRPLSRVLKENRELFCSTVQLIFQNPYLSLDPKWKIRRILEEGIPHFSRPARAERISEALRLTHLSETLLDRYPSALSGGERQRVALARALAIRPKYLILDEPTASLDALTQKEIISLLKNFRDFFHEGLLLVTHDLAMASQIADGLVVLRQGKIVEQGLRKDLLNEPSHEYTRELLEALPKRPKAF